MRDLRIQTDLRQLIDSKRRQGFEVVNRDPMRLERTGCPIAYEVRNGVLVEVQR